jgi:DNA-binding LacI/PurR family transcriptional regulator
MLYPALTTIREFPEQLGKQMVELLLRRISEPLLPPQSVTIPTEFIKRDSCKSILTHPVRLALENAQGALTG